MISDIEIIKEPFNSCFQSLRVLLLFIMDEYLHADIAIHEMNQLLKIIEEKDPSNKVVKRLQEILMQLSRPASQLPWNRNTGSLTKLKRLFRQYPQIKPEEQKTIQTILENLAKAHTMCIQALEQLHDHRGVAAHIAKISQTTRHIKSFIVEAVKQFDHDENILLFLLQHQKVLKRIYGQDFLKKMLPTLFQKYPKKQDMEKFLIDRYTQRGFDTIETTIKEMIAQLP